MANNLKGVDGYDHLYKLDGRGTVAHNDRVSIRHSVDKISDDHIQEHTVVTDKNSKERLFRSNTYKKDENGTWQEQGVVEKKVVKKSQPADRSQLFRGNSENTHSR